MSSDNIKSTNVPVGRPGEEFDSADNDNTKIELVYNQNVRPQPERDHEDDRAGGPESGDGLLLYDALMATLQQRVSAAQPESLNYIIYIFVYNN